MTSDAHGVETALARLGEGLAEDERARLRERLWGLLARQAARMTQGDSASLPVERAEALFASLCRTLDRWLDATGQPPQALLRGDPDEALRAGWALLERATATAAARYREALAGAPPYANRALRDTLRGIAPFFRRYDWRLAADAIPAEIDYPLCLPVPDALWGVDWLDAYLRRLCAENRLLARYAPAEASAVLAAYYGAFDEPLVNLYEPVAARAVGLALAGRAPRADGAPSLRCTPDDRARLRARLRALAPDERADALRAAAGDAARGLALPPEDARYLADAAARLAPRLALLLPDGPLHPVFACGAEPDAAGAGM